MANLILSGSTSGSVTLSSPAVSGTTTLTFPASTGNVVTDTATQTLTNKTITSPTITGATITVASTAAPTFSYYQSSAQTLSSGTFTKLTFTSNDWDTTSGMFASSKFTPTIAGYYQISAGFAPATIATGCFALLYKNGSNVKSLFAYQSSSGNAAYGSALVYLNGSTDYIEIYGYMIAGQALATGTANTYFQGFMARSA
jgi:hypothetical protein